MNENANGDARFEHLKSRLFDHGYDAITSFLGYEYPADEDKDVTDNRMDEVYAQMPPEELEPFYRQYGV